jgi:hypothetical protein
MLAQIFKHKSYLDMQTGGAETMMGKKLLFSALELKRLITDIKDHEPNICIRFRSVGEMWQTQMMRLITITENRVLVHNEISNKLISIDLNNVMQFEIDGRFRDVEPHYHYEVRPIM